MTLNPAQQAAVDSKAALKVVIAGPGSGKTRTEIKAVKQVFSNESLEVYQRQGRLPRVAIMTFTNAGANEFRNRLGDLSKSLKYCGTLHGYCFKLIQRFGGFLGYIPGKVGILPDAERIPRLLACRDKLGHKISQKALLAGLPSTWVATGDTPQSVVEGTALVWREYEFLLKRNNLVDYDGILRVALELLRMSEVRCQIKLDYLFVDEFQDSAQIDQLIYEAIPALNKMYVGDGDQSIYAFRGAHPKGFLEKLAYGEEGFVAEGHKLELNYRSDSDICDAANDLIACNKERVEKRIIPTSGRRGQVQVDAYEEVMQELAAIGGCCSASLATKQSIAVLYRMNYDVKQCRDYLQAMGLPVQVPKFEQRPPDWERAMLLLALCASPGNEILEERLLKLDHSVSEVDRWRIESRATGQFGAFLSKGGIDASIFDGWMRLNFRNTPVMLARLGVGEGTVRLISDCMALLAPDADLSDLLHDLHSNEETKANPPNGGIVVSTIHGAKGREWDVVFLPAFEQGIIPHVLSTAKNPPPMDLGELPEVEEERRLAFVAVTRAKHELYISHCAHRRGPWGPVGLGQPSQFIAEMGL